MIDVFALNRTPTLDGIPGPAANLRDLSIELPPGFAATTAHAEIARPSDLPRITDALVRRGFAESDIRKVLGENVLRVLREVMVADDRR